MDLKTMEPLESDIQDRTKGGWEARLVPQHRSGHLQARRRQEAALHPASEGQDAQLRYQRVDIGILAPEPSPRTRFLVANRTTG